MSFFVCLVLSCFHFLATIKLSEYSSNDIVMDMNDNPPKFEQSSYSCSLSQHAIRGQFVTIVSASDPDYIDSNSLIYAIAGGNEQQTYSIDAISGIITLVNMQNFAENQSATLNISVTDSVYTTFIRVQINILPGNMHCPEFSHSVYDVKINENQLAGRLVIRVSIRPTHTLRITGMRTICQKHKLSA